MQTLPSLPSELFEKILRFAIDIHPARHAIPRVNSTWASVSLPILHSQIKFTSREQLRLFSAAPGQLCHAPTGRKVEVFLRGGTEVIGLWALLYNVLSKCQGTLSPSRPHHPGVRALRLCLNAYLHGHDLLLIDDALCLIK